mmetsp:Transcript_8791/g.10064  ORF Transcript_8791/g.10064 Transcript_8791/m.10064 type:complete len:91 (-) Transcript_8791:334-606(-)
MASITSKLQDVSLSARQSIQDAKDATTATLSSPRLSLDGSTGTGSTGITGTRCLNRRDPTTRRRRRRLFRSGYLFHLSECLLYGRGSRRS